MTDKIDIEEYDPDRDKKAFMAELESLRPDLIYSKGWSETQRQEAIDLLRPNKVKSTMLQGIPQICRGPDCSFAESCPLLKKGLAPVSESCHPPGELIYTVKHGYIKIEDLDEDFHKVMAWERHHDCFRKGTTTARKGFAIKKYSKLYEGLLAELTSSTGYSHKVTNDHISVARFNKNAIGKFCVYIMRKGTHWRIGKSKLVSESKQSKHRHKTHLGFPMRGNMEEADSMWILGVYDTNTEALLAEEEFSLKFQTSKVCFSDSLRKYNSKNNGMYKWATPEQLKEHHDKLVKDYIFYRDLLASFGLMIEHPIWKRGGFDDNEPEVGPYVNWPMYIRACNLIPGVMDVAIFDEGKHVNQKHGKRYHQPTWETLESVERKHYKGVVYSLSVEKHKTYVAGGIVTHNCPIEQSMILQLFTDYVEELEVDTSRMVEVSLVRDLVDQEIQHMRKTWLLRQESFIQENVVGIDGDGNVVTKKELHQAVEYEEKLLRRKEKLRNALLATREAKVKAGQGKADSATVVANILEEARKLENARNKALLKELGMAEDDYVEAELIDEDGE